MFEWTDKQNGVDDVLAEDINSIAHAVMDLDNEIDNQIGDIETALDSIISIQNTLIGGGSV